MNAPDKTISNSKNNEAKSSVYVINDKESPAAPIFSPLTPLITNKKKADILDESREQNSSPVQSMSPSTLELFQNLSGAQTPIQQLTENLDEMTNFEEIVINISNNEYLAEFSGSMNNEDIIRDFSSDTDTDYIPDSYSDSSDDDNKVVRSRKTIVAAIVHHDDTNNKNDLTTHPKDTNVTYTSEDSTVRTMLNETIECYPDENIEISNNDSNSDQIKTSLGRPKKGRKRKHPDFTVAQTKARKYANKCYLTKKKLVEPKVFIDYSCSCQKKCYQLVSTEKRQHEFQKFVTLGSYEAQALYIAKTGNKTIVEDIDGYDGELDFVPEETEE
ncbi:hypothetical protein PYW08_004174 [Mythimna loreyi]|uniref:Uncharacterized protein n=1 Tax=Mythimna loreyi TaxID=667449 RepID=A0ACC2QQQ1_9NEOP|nr:hypothetical protein PYW08_004174 [Mythimna loreyi]